MSPRRNQNSAALVLALALGSCVVSGAGCAGFGGSEAEDSPPLPATLVEIRAAIEAERAQLMNLVSEPADDSHPDSEALIEVAERLSRLQAARRQLELASLSSVSSSDSET